MTAGRVVETIPTDPVWSGMPLKVFNRAMVHIRETANLLGLYDWQLTLSHVAADDDDAGAMVRVIPRRRWATIHLASDFATFTDEQKHHYIVHELLHLHTNPMMQTIRDSMPDLLSLNTWTLFENVTTDHEERIVDNLATVLAPLLPPWPTR